MSRRWIVFGCTIWLASSCCIRVEPAAAGDITRGDLVYYLGTMSSAEARVYERLDQPITLDFEELTLEQAAAFIQWQTGIAVRLDTKALEDAGQSGETRCSPMHVSGIKLRSALKLLLKEMELAAVVEQEVLMITSKESADSSLSTLLYNVRHLTAHRNKEFDSTDFQTLVRLITSTIEPHSWDEVGGPGTIEPLRVQGECFLIVSQTADVHDQIADLLVTLRRNVQKLSAARAKPTGKPRAQSARPLRGESRVYADSPSWSVPAVHD